MTANNCCWLAQIQFFQIFFALFFEILFSVLPCRAQYIISGKVTDSKTADPIPFVNIFIKSTNSGTSSNAYGAFSLKLDDKSKNDSLIFSVIGYQTLKKSIAEIHTSKVTNFVLQDTVYQLKAFVFKDTLESAVNIIRKAMNNVKLNYGIGPHKMEAIFRIIDRENGSYARMLEAAINIYDPNFLRKNSRKVEYLAIRQTKDFRTFKWKMNNSNVRIVEDLLQPDLIKRPTRATHENGFNIGFTYEFEKMTYMNGDEIYVILVEKKSTAQWANYDATFYVRVKDLSIIRVERTYTIARANWVKASDMITRITKDKLILVYKEIKGKFYLNYFSWELKGQALNRKSNKVELDFQRWEELSVHHVSPEKKPRKIREAWDKDIYQMIDLYDDKFWQNYPTVDTELFKEVKKQISTKESLNRQSRSEN